MDISGLGGTCNAIHEEWRDVDLNSENGFNHRHSNDDLHSDAAQNEVLFNSLLFSNIFGGIKPMSWNAQMAQDMVSSNRHMKYVAIGMTIQTVVHVSLMTIAWMEWKRCTGLAASIRSDSSVKQLNAVALASILTVSALGGTAISVVGMTIMSRLYAVTKVPENKMVNFCIKKMPAEKLKFDQGLALAILSTWVVYGTQLAPMCNKDRFVVLTVCFTLNAAGHLVALQAVRATNRMVVQQQTAQPTGGNRLSNETCDD